MRSKSYKGCVFVVLNSEYKNGIIVAKKQKGVLVKLVSTAGTGVFWVKKRNPKTQSEKLSFRKYDPVVRKHVDFKEEKIK